MRQIQHQKRGQYHGNQILLVEADPRKNERNLVFLKKLTTIESDLGECARSFRLYIIINIPVGTFFPLILSKQAQPQYMNQNLPRPELILPDLKRKNRRHVMKILLAPQMILTIHYPQRKFHHHLQKKKLMRKILCLTMYRKSLLMIL